MGCYQWIVQSANNVFLPEGGGGAQEAAWCDEDARRVGWGRARTGANRVWKGESQHSIVVWNRGFQKYVKVSNKSVWCLITIKLIYYYIFPIIFINL